MCVLAAARALAPLATLVACSPTLPQRKRLEPFEVPKSSAYWLHDDRGAGENGGGAAGGEEDEEDQGRGEG